MPRTYLDSNIYIIGLLRPETDSAIILREVVKGDIVVVQSDYLMDEVLGWFKRKMGKDWAGKARLFMLSVPERELIHSSEWSLLMPRWKNLIDDKDDIPHICSYFAADCDYFVTTNRKLTRMKIGAHVAFRTPDEFVRTALKHDKEVLDER